MTDASDHAMRIVREYGEAVQVAVVVVRADGTIDIGTMAAENHDSTTFDGMVNAMRAYCTANGFDRETVEESEVDIDHDEVSEQIPSLDFSDEAPTDPDRN